MKTLTEFPAMNLKQAAQLKTELLTQGKTTEELPQALGEALKLEGDRLNFLVNALDIIDKKLNDLKRTVVFSLNEGEKAPVGAVQKSEHYYLVEYYPPVGQPGKRGANEPGDSGRDDKKRGKGKGKGGRFRKPRNPQAAGGAGSERRGPSPAAPGAAPIARPVPKITPKA